MDDLGPLSPAARSAYDTLAQATEAGCVERHFDERPRTPRSFSKAASDVRGTERWLEEWVAWIGGEAGAAAAFDATVVSRTRGEVWIGGVVTGNERIAGTIASETPYVAELRVATLEDGRTLWVWTGRVFALCSDRAG